MKTVICVVLAFFAGFVIRHIIPIGGGVGSHWAAVEEYNEYMRNPSNYERHPSGLASTTEPFKIEPHLAVLVAEDELIHDDIVLPNVTETREISKHWMAYCDKNYKEIVWATSSGYPDEKGPRPVHLNLWYKPSAQPLVDQLIEELKAMGSERSEADNVVELSELDKIDLDRIANTRGNETTPDIKTQTIRQYKFEKKIELDPVSVELKKGLDPEILALIEKWEKANETERKKLAKEIEGKMQNSPELLELKQSLKDLLSNLDTK